MHPFPAQPPLCRGLPSPPLGNCRGERRTTFRRNEQDTQHKTTTRPSLSEGVRGCWGRKPAPLELRAAAHDQLFAKFLHSVFCCNVFHHEAGKNIVNRQLFLDSYQTTTAEGAIAPQHRNLLTPARSGEIFSPCRRHPEKAT